MTFRTARATVISNLKTPRKITDNHHHNKENGHAERKGVEEAADDYHTKNVSAVVVYQLLF